VGKSSLINSIFHENLDETRIGRSVTQYIKEKMKMIIAISAVFGLHLKNEFIEQIIKIIFIDGNKLVLKVEISNVLKFIPSVNVVGAKISKSKLSRTIEEIGNIYINALYYEFKKKWRTSF